MKTFNELRESSKDVLLKRYHKYKDKQMSPAEAQQFRQLVRKLKAMGVSLKEETVEEKFKVSYKDKGSYSVVFRNKNGKVESEVRADSKEKAEKQAALRNKRVKPSEGAWEVIKTANESVEESTKEYGKSQEKIRDKKKKDAISSSDKEKLARLKKMMSKESVDLGEGYKSPAEAQAIADGKKAARQGKKYEDNPHKKGSKEFTAWSKGHNMARESVEETAKSHPQGSAKFYRGAMDKYKAKTPKKSHWDMYLDYMSKRKTKKEGDRLKESLRKDISQLSSKFPEGSKVKMKHNGKVATVLSVGKDYVKVGIGNKTMDHKPSELISMKESVNESKDVFFDSYSSAISHAIDQAKKKGYEVDEDDVFREITTGQGKPGRGKTVRHTLKLTKGGKPQRKALQIQVYNRETAKNPFELNSYIS